MLGPSAHIDTFTRDNLPPEEQWPNFLLDGFDYPEYLNAGVELTDVWSKRVWVTTPRRSAMAGRWRFNHVTTVERIIGMKRSTGGTSGASYLKRCWRLNCSLNSGKFAPGSKAILSILKTLGRREK
jgi:hypothetical protein